jgi:hypothetical protein
MIVLVLQTNFGVFRSRAFPKHIDDQIKYQADSQNPCMNKVQRFVELQLSKEIIVQQMGTTKKGGSH